MTCIRVLHDLTPSRLCLERVGETASGTSAKSKIYGDREIRTKEKRRTSRRSACELGIVPASRTYPARSVGRSGRPTSPVGSSRSHPPRESLANWLRSSVGRYRHVGHTGGMCGLGRPSAAPSQVDGRSWERHFQRRDAKCVTILLNCDS